LLATNSQFVGWENISPVRLTTAAWACSSPIRCTRHEKDFFLLGASSSVWDCRLIVDRRKMLAENVNRALAGLQGKVFGHQKMALESTLRLHNDGAGRRVSAEIESGLHAQNGFL
jgi:hypothetical protein